MFKNRIRRFAANMGAANSPQQSPFVLMSATSVAPAAMTFYRVAYQQAFATVEKRIVRRRQLHAARAISSN
ncbi:MAG TPA: hypothetical protein VHC22_23095 [Pirellulales bacterium]|nr:hypothetical protein [Pirellulales bacterium]